MPSVKDNNEDVDNTRTHKKIQQKEDCTNQIVEQLTVQ